MASVKTNDDDHANDKRSDSSKPFRFKRQSSLEGNTSRDNVKERRKRRTHVRDPDRSSSSPRKRRKRSHEDSEPNRIHFDAQVAPDIAFQESLFDAMGDDEGAAFWEGVYGQPIHTYSQSYRDPESGQVESMDDEQYAKYVRQQMWERSAEGINAAREAKRRASKHRQDHQRQQEEYQPSDRPQTGGPYNNFAYDFESNSQSHTQFDADIEASLFRGQQRRDDKRWQKIWKNYQNDWEKLLNVSEAWKKKQANGETQICLRDYIAWPVESNEVKDVSAEEIDRFIGRISKIREEQASFDTAAFLKSERIRWHPDKIQQRYGFMHIDEATMAGVTATFQVIDKMWNDSKGQRV